MTNRSQSKNTSLMLAFGVAAIFQMCGCGQKSFEPRAYDHAKASMLAGMVSTERINLMGNSSDDDGEVQFAWAFEDAKFKLTGASIPSDLLSTLGAEPSSAEIEGEWSMENEIVEFKNIVVDGEPSKIDKCRLRSFYGGDLHLVTGQAQYVFTRNDE